MSKLSGLQCRIRNSFNRLKVIFLKSKLHFYICLACVAAGFILAAAKDYSGFTKSANFIAAIANNAFTPFADIIWIGIFTTLVFVIVFMAGLNFWLFILSGYGGLIMTAYFLWKAIFIAFAIDGFMGFLYFILFMLPVFLFNTLMYIIALARVYEISGYRHNRKCIVGLRCQSRLLFEAIKKYWLYALLFNYILWLIIMLIFIIFF